MNATTAATTIEIVSARMAMINPTIAANAMITSDNQLPISILHVEALESALFRLGL